MMVSVVVGFLNISKVNSLALLFIVRSRKFNLPSRSLSNVNASPGIMLLNKLRISSMFVRLSLKLASLDISNMYTNIPTEELLNIIDKMCDKHNIDDTLKLENTKSPN